MKTRIGFFDSGIGGINVMAYARKIIPSADYLYYADIDNVPYGTKSPDEVIRYCCSAMDWMLQQKADIVVIACNTATSMAAETLRRIYPIPIIGMEPAVKPAALRHPHEKILVCATQLTINGEKLHTLIDHSFSDCDMPDLVALPGLVTMAENNQFDKYEAASYLSTAIDSSQPYAAIVLGCTHFSYFRESFRILFPNAELIDGTDGTVRRLVSVLTECNKLPQTKCTGNILWSVSGKTDLDPFIISKFEMLSKL